MPNRPGKPLNDPRLDLVTPTILKFTKLKRPWKSWKLCKKFPNVTGFCNFMILLNLPAKVKPMATKLEILDSKTECLASQFLKMLTLMTFF